MINPRFHSFLIAAVTHLLVGCVVGSLCINIASAQEVAIDATAERQTVQIAEPFVFEIVAKSDQSTELAFPIVPEELGPFEVFAVEDRFDIPDSYNANMRTWTRRMTLETFRTGELEIPSLTVSYSNANGENETIETKPLSIKVLSVLENNVDTQQFRDIRSVVDVDSDSKRTWWWLAGPTIVVSILVLGCFLIFAVMRRKRYVTPKTWALQKLSESSTNDLSQAESTLRKFLEMQFEFPATSFSILEIEHELQVRQIANQAIADVTEIFTQVEQSKFGGIRLDERQRVELFFEIRSVVVRLAAKEAEVKT